MIRIYTYIAHIGAIDMRTNVQLYYNYCNFYISHYTYYDTNLIKQNIQYYIIYNYIHGGEELNRTILISTILSQFLWWLYICYDYTEMRLMIDR